MGVYRFGLSALVVLFHFGGLGPVSGRVVVFTFFVLSGYLMALVLTRTYGTTPRGAGAFYLNRTLRLVPPFIVVAALTLLFMGWRDGRGFYIDPLEPEWLGVSTGNFLNLGWQWAHQWQTWPPSAGGEFTIDPPTWSLVSEGCFYLAAPLLALLLFKAKPLFAAVIGVSVAIAITSWARPDLTFDDSVYQNVFGSIWTFGLGMALFALRDPLRRRLPDRALRWAGPAGLLVGGVFLLKVMRDVQPATEARIYSYLAISSLAILLLGLHREWPRWFRETDRRLGDIAYGVFLGHFLAALILLALAEQITRHTGVLNPFGRLNTREFGQWTLLATIVLSLGIFRTVEAPIQRMRGRVRASAGGTAAPRGPAEENTDTVRRGGLARHAPRLEAALGVTAMVATVGAVVWLATRALPTPPAASAATVASAPADGPGSLQVMTASTGHGALAWAATDRGRLLLRVASRNPGGALQSPVPVAVPGDDVEDLRGTGGRAGQFALTWRWHAAAHPGRDHVALALLQAGAPTQVVQDIGARGPLAGPALAHVPSSGGAIVAWVERDGDRWAVRALRIAPANGAAPQVPAPTIVRRGTGAPPRLTGVGGDDAFAELALDRGGRVLLAAQEGDGAWQVHDVGRGVRPSLAVDRSRALAAAARDGARRVLTVVGQEPEPRVYPVAARRGATVAADPVATVDQRGFATVVWPEQDADGTSALRAVVLRPDGPVLSQVVARGRGPLRIHTITGDMQGGISVLAERDGTTLLLRREPLRPDGQVSPAPRWRTDRGVLPPGVQGAALAPLAAGGAVLGWWADGAVRARILEAPLPDA